MRTTRVTEVATGQDWPFEPKESDRTDAQKSIWDAVPDEEAYPKLPAFSEPHEGIVPRDGGQFSFPGRVPLGEGIWLQDEDGNWDKLNGVLDLDWLTEAEDPTPLVQEIDPYSWEVGYADATDHILGTAEHLRGSLTVDDFIGALKLIQQSNRDDLAAQGWKQP